MVDILQFILKEILQFSGSTEDNPVLLLNGYKTKDAYEDGEDIEVFCATHASARPLDIDIRWSGSGIETANSEDIRLGDL